MAKVYPIKLKAPLKDYLWGGTRLRDEYGKATDMDKVAESWEVSCHKDGRSVIENGEYAGKTLEEYIEAEGREVLGPRAAAGDGFPVLIKFIDAKQSLSVQVHPDNEYAMRVEGEPGKTEMWYVMDAEPGAKLIYGFNKEITKEEMRERIENNTLMEVCREVPVKKGDTFFIAAGTLHAIGAGTLICEVQQSSNTTYRVYDYGRVGKDGKPRELHIEKALDVTKLAPLPLNTEPLSHFDLAGGGAADVLAKCRYFTTYRLRLTATHETKMANPEKSFRAISVLAGTVELKSAAGNLTLGKGESAFIPARMGEYTLTGDAECLMVAY